MTENPVLDRFSAAESLHLTAELALGLALGCPFSTDARWFWNLAAAELDAYLWARESRTPEVL